MTNFHRNNTKHSKIIIEHMLLCLTKDSAHITKGNEWHHYYISNSLMFIINFKQKKILCPEGSVNIFKKNDYLLAKYLNCKDFYITNFYSFSFEQIKNILTNL